MKKVAILFALFATPMLASAQGLSNLQNLVKSLQNLINLLVPVVIGIAFLAFLWGLAVFIFKSGDEDAKEKGKRTMIGGIIALFVMLAIWGIVEFIGNALDIDVGGSIDAPEIPR